MRPHFIDEETEVPSTGTCDGLSPKSMFFVTVLFSPSDPKLLGMSLGKRVTSKHVIPQAEEIPMSI